MAPSGAAPSADYYVQVDQASVGLRVVAIFVILIASLVGSCTPLFVDLTTGSRWKAVRVLKAGCAGSILALALIHMGGDSFSQFSALPPDAGSELAIGYPWASLCMLFAIMLMAVLENVMVRHSIGAGDLHGHSHGIASSAQPLPAGAHAACGLPSSSASAPRPMHRGSNVALAGTSEHDVAAGMDGAEEGLAQEPQRSRHSHVCVDTKATTLVRTSAAREAATAELIHMQQQAEAKPGIEYGTQGYDLLLKAVVVAYMMELGCVFHSVIIGIDLGLGGPLTSVQTRIVVLCFHQMMEGLGLGVVIATAGFNRYKAMAMTLFYSLTTPVGVAIGIATSATYDAGTITALGVNGAFNGVSAGLLLYVGLVTLLMEEFSNSELMLPRNDAVRYGMYGAMVLCAGILAVIGIWA